MTQSAVMLKLVASGLALALTLAACGGASADTRGVPDIPDITVEGLEQILAGLDRPAVVNVWASWCIPCRSEAPLLVSAHQAFGAQVEFIGIDVQDNQADAKAFIAEFGLEYDNYFDRNRAIPINYGGIGTPITFFFLPGGRLDSTHNGVIDERALALGIDELLRSGS